LSKVLAIVAARAGSKGVPSKNVRELQGKPVVAYSLEAALAAKRVDRVAVSTDDARAMAVAQAYDVGVAERPAELASDTARIDEALRHCCAALQAQDGYVPDVVVMLYANVPVRSEGIIDRAVEHLLTTGADSVQTLTNVGKYHPYWLYQMNGDRISKYIDNEVYRRQELPPVYAIDSAVGAMRYEVLRAAAGSDNPHAMWGTDRRGIAQEAHETVDIDHLRDFFLAEATLRQRANEEAVQLTHTEGQWHG